MKKDTETSPAMTKLLDAIQAENKRVDAARKARVPEIGTLWRVNGELIYDSVPWADQVTAEEFFAQPQSHARLWPMLQRLGVVPREDSYETHPRGRVDFNRRLKRFVIHADICILADEKIVDQIIRDFRLPTPVNTESDDDYRCAKCSGMKQR